MVRPRSSTTPSNPTKTTRPRWSPSMTVASAPAPRMVTCAFVQRETCELVRGPKATVGFLPSRTRYVHALGWPSTYVPAGTLHVNGARFLQRVRSEQRAAEAAIVRRGPVTNRARGIIDGGVDVECRSVSRRRQSKEQGYRPPAPHERRVCHGGERPDNRERAPPGPARRPPVDGLRHVVYPCARRMPLTGRGLIRLRRRSAPRPKSKAPFVTNYPHGTSGRARNCLDGSVAGRGNGLR